MYYRVVIKLYTTINLLLYSDLARGAPPQAEVLLGGTQTGSYQTGSYQKGRFIPPKPKLLYLYFLIRPRLYASELRAEAQEERERGPVPAVEGLLYMCVHIYT